jgi:uncharacterized protein (TIGR02284 family)
MSRNVTIAKLNQLIRTCRDTEHRCMVWSEAAARGHLRIRLRVRSEEWGRQGDELQALVLLLGGEPATSPTLRARAAGGWTTLRTLLAGQSDALALDGCEEAQQAALRQFETALQGYLPERIRRTVSLQARQIFARCDRVAWSRGQFAVP